MIETEAILGLPGYEIESVERRGGWITIRARYLGAVECPHCGSQRLRSKGRYVRRVRHDSIGMRLCTLELAARKYLCRECGRQFRQRFPGIGAQQRSSEPYRKTIFYRHWDGISRKRLGQREHLGAATVERWFQHYLRRQVAERSNAVCPQVLGIDEHFFSRKNGFATTLCDLAAHKVFDVVLGRSELSLEPYFQRLEGKQRVLVVCMDLASNYRALVRKHFPQARIVADRFHVIRLINQQFLQTWRALDEVSSKNRGLVSLLRRHAVNLSIDQSRNLDAYLAQQPALELAYRFKQRLCQLLLIKHRTVRQCRKLIQRLLPMLAQLRACGLAALEQLGRTLTSWREEIACMWRFTRNNGITEGFHTKMEVLQRQAYGFRNFESYRLRVRLFCS